MSMMSRGAHEANMESAARAGYGKVAEQAARIAQLEAHCERLSALLRKGAALVAVGSDATDWVEELRTEHVI